MKTEFTADKEFILQAHKEACSDWKQKIEYKFPDAFNTVGKWTIFRHEDHEDSLVFNTGGINYGIVCSKWGDNYSEYDELATDKEVEKALIKEAKIRGLVEGCSFRSYWIKDDDNIVKEDETLNIRYIYEENQLMIYNGVFFTIYKDGVWAEPIENSTLKRIQEIEKELKELKKQQQT